MRNYIDTTGHIVCCYNKLSIDFGAWTTDGRPYAIHAARDQSTLCWDGTSSGLCCHGRCHFDRSCSPGASQPVRQQMAAVSVVRLMGFQWFPGYFMLFSRLIAFRVKKRIKTNWEPRLYTSLHQEFQGRLLCQTFQLKKSRTTYPTRIE